MARLKKYLLLKRLGMVPVPLSVEQLEATLKLYAEKEKKTRRWRMTPYQMAWLWREPERLRQRARAAVSFLIVVRDASGSEPEANVSAHRASGSRRMVDRKEPPHLADNPFQVLFENFKRHGAPEDLRDLAAQLKLYQQLFREEAARAGLELHRASRAD